MPERTMAGPIRVGLMAVIGGPRSHLRDPLVGVCRLVLGVIFAAHGWQKVHTWGVAATADNFTETGVPAPTASAWYAAVVELGCGALLALGALTAVAGLLLALDMAGAFWFVHLGGGVFSPSGWELVVALGAGALMLAVGGPGRFSLDHAVRHRLAGLGEVPVSGSG